MKTLRDISQDVLPSPKTYADFMDEISPSEVYEGLLAHGLFSEKLPPIFTSEPFFEYCQSSKDQNPRFERMSVDFVYYESIRNINTPRPFGIPNPMAYQLLCRCISDNWGGLQKHFKSATEKHGHIVSRIHIRKMLGKPSLFEMNYPSWRTDGTPEPDLLIGAKYLVKADISNCFSSIYSHALSWALAGKYTAKSSKTKKEEWYNKLDHAVMNLHNGETHGVMIGPHASNVLSEIILVKIDQVLYDAGWKYIRNIDDYDCYVDSCEKGQDFLIDLNEQLRLYGLTLNHKKTEIAELPLASIEHWVRKINFFMKPTPNNCLDFRDIQAYLDLAIDLMHKNKNNASVVNYAIKTLAGRKMSQNAQQYCVKTIFHLALLFPYLVPLLDDYVFKPYDVNTNHISAISQKIIDFGIKRRDYEQVCFAIFFAIKYNFAIKLDFEIAKKSAHCLFMLMCYLYYKQNDEKENKNLCEKYAKELLSNNRFDSYWLFIFEVLPANELPEKWKHIKENKISFVRLPEQHKFMLTPSIALNELVPSGLQWTSITTTE